MCGITGYFSLDNSLNPHNFAAANNLINYRGPDDFGFVFCSESGKISEYHDENLTSYSSDEKMLGALGFRRLAIIDLSPAGHQPMPDKQRKHWIVFNGEVYNYIEIRKELEQLGYQFQSKSDTEVILTAYCHWGASCLDRFNGMFALAILDIEKKSIFCARDRFGIKPFVYYLDDNKFIFASEPKQISCLLNKQLDLESLSSFEFIIHGAKNHTDRTFYKDISELRGGETLQVDLSNSKKIQSKRQKWWDLKPSIYSGSEQDAADELLHLLKDSIRIRLRSDVPTGTALSGGLDSNGVVALIDELTSDQQSVFTVSSNDVNSDETVFAERAVVKYGLNSHKIDFGTQNIETLEKITFHHDQPLTNAGAFGGWILQTLIQDSNIIVNLNGQGADELMGGYSRPPHALKYLDSLSSGSILDAHQQLFSGIRNSSQSFPVMAKALAQDSARILLRSFTQKKIESSRKSSLDKNFFLENVRQSEYSELFRTSIDFNSIFKKNSYNELKTSQLPSLLHNVDRDSMAHSLESRVPFLDYRIAEHIFSLPAEFLLNKGYTKYIYRKAMVGKIDNEVLWNTNKKGFATPVNDYLSIGHEYFSELLNNQTSHEVVDMRWAREAFTRKKPQESAMLWRVMCFLIWDRQRTAAT